MEVVQLLLASLKWGRNLCQGPSRWIVTRFINLDGFCWKVRLVAGGRRPSNRRLGWWQEAIKQKPQLVL